MEITKIAPMESWENIENGLFELYNLQGSVFNTDGIRITKTKNWSNRLCPVIKSLDKGQSFICAVAHMNMANQAKQTKKYVIEECDAGLLKLLVPIFFKDEYLGVIGGCGLLAEDGEIDTFAINKLIDMDDDKIGFLSSDIPLITNEKACLACEYIKEQLDKIIKENQ
jgi:ligand-binding sensor protein